MNFPHPWSRPSALSRAWGPAASSIVVALLAVLAAFGVVAAAQALWPDEEPAAAAVPPSVNLLAAPPRLRCETCGRIEAITRNAAVGDVPESYTFSVRLPDGSLRLSSDPSPGRWQVGDRMQLLGGGIAWSVSP